MASFRLTIEKGQFCDGQGRQVVLRGINLAGDSKLPSEPEQPSHLGTDFWNGDQVTFHQRPFTKEDAPTHFARIRRYGFNTIRYVFTWEAIEAASPGVYDETFIQHTIEILRVAKRFGFYIFMDPHQDVWSRFTGGSGAPLWTLYACGLNPQGFAATEAAIVHNTYPDPAEFPKMIWSTNYYRLAAATIFTMFFAGRDFAPKCVIDGVNIQEYLQSHFISACAHLAKRIREAGDLENDPAIGWESMNEPNKGMTGYFDLSVIPKERPLKKGTCPTMWQTFLTGMGRACEIDTWDMGGLGPRKVGTRLVDPCGETAWLPEDYDDASYGWKRDPEWRLGECIWAQHGVWDTSQDMLLKKDYFQRNPHTGAIIDYPEFTITYFMEFWRKYKQACRKQHKNCIMLMQYPTLELPPEIEGTEDDDPLLAFSPHFYDGITLMTKHWNRTWNVDVVGVLRGKYWHPALAIRIGETAIRNCLKDQLATLRQEGLDRIGKHPCVLTEFGIPFDMDDKKAYQTGDYISQSAALDANYFGVEGSRLEGHCVWVYCVINDHEWGDQWNGEDLSINSLDQIPPETYLPRSPSNRSASHIGKLLVSSGGGTEEGTVTPMNISRTLSNPSISSFPSIKNPDLANASGLRAADAFCRPSPTAVTGDIISSVFDLRSCAYNLRLIASRPCADVGPTVISLPDYHFSKEQCEIAVSSGKWELFFDDVEGVLLQHLRWWHAEGEQHITIRGTIRDRNALSGGTQDAGFWEQCQETYGVNLGNCTVM